MDIDGLGEKQAKRFLEDGLIADAAGIYELTAEQLTGLEGFGEVSAREPARRRSSSRSRCRSRASSSRSASTASARSPRRRWRATSARSTTCSRPARSGSRRSTASARSSPSRSSSSSPTSATLALIADLRRHGLRFELDESERRAEEGPLQDKTFVLTGTLPDLSREQATELIKARRRQGDRLGLEEDRLRRRRRQPGLEAREGREARRRDHRRGRAARRCVG